MAPYRVVTKFTALSEDEVKDLFLAVQKVQKVLEQLHGANSSSIVIQDGKDAGQSVEVCYIQLYSPFYICSILIRHIVVLVYKLK